VYGVLGGFLPIYPMTREVKAKINVFYRCNGLWVSYNVGQKQTKGDNMGMFEYPDGLIKCDIRHKEVNYSYYFELKQWAIGDNFVGVIGETVPKYVKDQVKKVAKAMEIDCEL